MDKSEILTNVGILLAGLFAGIIAYFGKKPPKSPVMQDAVVSGVGLELGNRLQIDQLIGELKRIADSLAILADRKQATMEAKLDRILQDLDEAEERDKEIKEGISRRPATRPPRNRKPRS